MYRMLWTFSQKKRNNIILYTCMTIIANVFDFFPPLIIAKILNIIQVSGFGPDTIGRLIWYAALFAFMEIGFWAFHGPSRVIEMSNAFRAAANYKKHLVDGIMQLPADWHTNHHSGDTIDKVEKATNGLKDFGGHTFEITQAIVRLIGSYIALVYFDLNASYLALLFIIMTFALIVRIDRVIVRRYKQLNLFQNEISAKVYDAISNITTIVILRIEKLISKTIAKKLYFPYGYDRKTNKINEVKWFLVSLFIMSMTFAIIVTYFLTNLKTGSIVLVGTVSALFNYSTRIGQVFYSFAYRYGDIVKWRTAVANAEDVSKRFSKRTMRKQEQLHKNPWKQISITNLSFSYEERQHHKLHLDNVSLTIKRKQRIALIGASGSGKTTMLKILREIYTPHTIKVDLDGKALPAGIASLSSHIMLIPQEPELFSTTIRENITLGLPKNTKTIKKFTDLARFSDVVKRLPKGLSSSIVEKGVNLSGGEKQRLALARGLLFCQDKELLLLDEPTSSVDTKNELAIYQNIFSTFKQKTIISSIHRLHLLPLFDHIYFFKGGRIIAAGSYEALKKQSPEFRKLLERYHRQTKQQARKDRP